MPDTPDFSELSKQLAEVIVAAIKFYGENSAPYIAPSIETALQSAWARGLRDKTDGRRITQLCPDATGDLLALCNDGTVLRLAAYGQRWVRYGGEVPQD